MGAIIIEYKDPRLGLDNSSNESPKALERAATNIKILLLSLGICVGTLGCSTTHTAQIIGLANGPGIVSASVTEGLATNPDDAHAVYPRASNRRCDIMQMAAKMHRFKE